MTRLLAAAALLAALVSTPAAADPGDVTIREAKAFATSEGEVLIDADPDDAYEIVADHRNWTAIFPALARVRVKSRRGDKLVVAVTSTKGKRHTLRFDNDPKRRIIRYAEDDGRVDAEATLTFTAGPRAGTTIVRGRLHADVTGAASWLVSDAKVQRKRQRRLAKDLRAIRDYFATH